MIVYLLNIGKMTGNWSALVYEFDDETGKSLTRTHIYRKGERVSDRFVTWSVREMEAAYGAKKGEHPNHVRGAFGDMTGTGLWRRVSKCQCRSFLKKNGVIL